MAQTDVYGDPKFSVPIDIPVVTSGIYLINSNQAAENKFGWRPFLKAKINAVCVNVTTAGSLACGFTIFRGTTSIGAIVCSASAAGYRGTWAPTGTTAIFDPAVTTDVLNIKNIDSNASLVATITVNYQNQY